MIYPDKKYGYNPAPHRDLKECQSGFSIYDLELASDDFTASEWVTSQIPAWAKG